MRVVRNGSVDPFSLLRREMDQWLHGLNRAVGNPAPTSGGVFPALNVWDAGEAFHVEAELPGLKWDELDVSVLGNELTLSGNYPAKSQENATYHRRERGVGSFKRVLKLPTEVNAEKVEAELSAGVLKLVLPKAEAAKPRKIEVRQG
ncbi:MAG TPA: Hsp20/alpha crystallin family protein [Pirellulales bacterium]